MSQANDPGSIDPVDNDWWDRGMDCEKHLIPSCAFCKPTHLPPVVQMTRGRSAAFHKTVACTGLSNGQAFVNKIGGTPAPVETVALVHALGSGRVPCLVCWPQPTEPGARHAR